MRCRLLLQMIAVYVRQSVRQSVCLSRGSTRLHSAKTAERIKILFGVNTQGAPRNTEKTGVLIAPQRGGGEFGKISPFGDPLHKLYQDWLQVNTWNFVAYREGWAVIKTMQQQVIGGQWRDLILFLDPLVSLKWLKLDIPARAVCVVHSMQPLPNYFVL